MFRLGPRTSDSAFPTAQEKNKSHVKSDFVSHSVENVGKNEVHALDIELKK